MFILIQFQEGHRKGPQMSPFAVNLSDADMQDIAAYFAAQQPVASQSGEPDPQKVAAGKRAAEWQRSPPTTRAPAQARTLADVECDYILQVLQDIKCVIDGRTEPRRGLFQLGAVRFILEQFPKLLLTFGYRFRRNPRHLPRMA